jgi:DNA-directed RNA polymerase specialized sigma24 family protein
MPPLLPGSEADPDRFHTTHWSLIVAAGQRESNQALARLCADYWPPLYAYVRRAGYSFHAAQDLTQEFFALLLDKNYLQDADRARGRFRSFLLAALKHFLANERKASRAQKRGGGKLTFSLDFQAAEQAFQTAPVDGRTPEWLFEQQWALHLLDRVIRRLAEEYAAAGKESMFVELQECLTGEPVHRLYRRIAADLALSEAAVKMAVHRLRKRYRELLRDEIAQTVAGPDEVEDEIRQLFTSLAENSS